MAECKLIIKSLHDAQAECACGHWRFMATGERTREHIEHEFKKHLVNNEEGQKNG